jgi:inorganic pyrophosphatase/exopolyphosphatase
MGLESKTTKKMVWTIGTLFCIHNLCMTLLTSFTNVTWEDISGFKRFQIFVGVIGNLAGIMMAYLSKTFARLDPSVGAIINGDAKDYQLKSTEVEVTPVKATDDKSAVTVTKTIESSVKQEVTPAATPSSELAKP